MKLRLVCNRSLFLAALTVLACIILPRAAAQKITETFDVPGLFEIDYGGFDGAFNSDGEQAFTFPGVCGGVSVYKAGLATIVGPPPSSPTPCPVGIATDSGGNFWFVDNSNQAVWVMTSKGVMTEYPSPNSGCYAVGCEYLQGGITLGSDGAMWVSSEVIVSFNQGIPNYEFQVARVASNGAFTYYTVPQLFNPSIGDGIATGSDGNVYIQDSEHITKITPAGQATVYTTASECKINPSSYLHNLTLGPDGNIWFISNCTPDYPTSNIIGNITPSGVITTFPITTIAQGLAAGSDGAIWFTTASYEIGRITTSGIVTYTAIPTNKLPKESYGCVGTPDYSKLTTIIQGPKDTLQFIGVYDVSGGSYNCTYFGSFTPTAPDDSQQQQALSVKPDLETACGIGSVNKCQLDYYQGPTTVNQDIAARSAIITYTYFSNKPALYITLTEVQPFGLCNITVKGSPVYEPFETVPLGLIPQGDDLPLDSAAYFFKALTVANSGAKIGTKAKCTFSWNLTQNINGTQATLLQLTKTYALLVVQ